MTKKETFVRPRGLVSLLFLFSLMAFLSCSTDAPLTEQLAYKRFHLKKLISWLLNNDADVKSTLLDIRSKNNKITTFYVENIINSIARKGIIDNETMEELTFSVEAFKNIQGESWNPTIRLTNFENYKNRNPYDNTKPLYAMEDYDEVNQEEIAVGYQENAEGELESIEEELTPALEDENDIIVLALESCDPNQQQSQGGGQQQEEGFCGPFGGGGYDPPPSSIKLRINKMTIKHFNENWPLRPEIHFQGFSLSAPFGSGDCGNAITGSANCYNYSGKRIDIYKRRWVSNQTEKTQNFRIKTQPNYSSPEVIYYVIFEEDSFPASLEAACFDMPNGDIRCFEYRTNNNAYDQQKLHMNIDDANADFPYAPGFSIDKNSIKYNLTHSI
ncbi:MAG: hypothetical protein L3J09_07375 [Flavobacteriaceae bacterium]|nr:hypothetical protein [Flavobacteriaceae bacterium]